MSKYAHRVIHPQLLEGVAGREILPLVVVLKITCLDFNRGFDEPWQSCGNKNEPVAGFPWETVQSWDKQGLPCLLAAMPAVDLSSAHVVMSRDCETLSDGSWVDH